jgi:hypothetical protein
VLRLSYYKFAVQADLFIVQPVKIELINESTPNLSVDCFPFTGLPIILKLAAVTMFNIVVSLTSAIY